MSEESILINPEELKKKRKSRESEQEEPEVYRMKGNSVEINFDSEGRFSLPKTMLFEDYSVADIQEFAVVDIDDILETLVVILDRLKNQDCEISIVKAVPHEFLEILFGMKAKFDTPVYKHHWMCECQHGKPEDEQQVSEVSINLGDFKFKSISEVDEKFRRQFKEVFKKVSPEEFKRYLKNKYKNNEVNIDLWDINQELESIKVKEPINYENLKDGRIYSFNLMRIENIIKAQRIVKDKYKPLIKSIHDRKNNGKPLHIFKAEKEEELKKVNRKKAKDIITYTEAMTLFAIDGKELKDNDERIREYSKLKRDDYFDLENFLKDIDFGLQYDAKLSCPLCGKTERRLLQQNIDPIELLPVDPDSKDRSIQRDGGQLNIYFGV